MKKEDNTIHTSTTKRMRAILIFQYLVSINPIISVPPVLPLAEYTKPKPVPQSKPPIITERKSPLKGGCSKK